MRSERTILLESMLKPSIEAMGYELWAIVYVPRHERSLVRVYIDSPKGIRLEDCERVSRQVSSVLDVEDPIRGGYVLEVSSPGLDRLLVRPEHFERFVDKKVDVTLYRLLNGRKHFKAYLAKVLNNEIELIEEGVSYLIPFELILQAKLIAVPLSSRHS